MTQNNSSTFRGVLLVAGTSIGGGMLALPVLTSLGGFLPSLVVYFFCWLFMACTGLLFLEISLWMHKDANIVSMSERTLGTGGKAFAWVLYLFLFYSLSVAYIVGCGDLVSQLFKDQIPEWLAPIIFVLCFAPIIFIGTHFVSKINVIFMFGLGISFITFLLLGFGYVQKELLFDHNWSKSLLALPIAFTSFAYQGIIPTLVSDMNYDVHRTRKAIVIGSFIPLIAYIVWQWLIQGIVPTDGPGGLAEALANGNNAVQPLKYFINSPLVYMIGQYFAFFALITSFFGVTLGLMDFLADGLNVKKTVSGKFLLCLLIFIPPLLISYTYPHIFLTALDYAGGYGCALLLGLLPIMMVWSARYRLGMRSPYTFPGGKVALVFLAVFVIFELVLEIKKTVEHF
ncbi:MAG: amino acid permease [Parachlamydiaceae bacterium]|nr:amino acid permease [Parachlamydiaceae bacterium]